MTQEQHNWFTSLGYGVIMILIVLLIGVSIVGITKGGDLEKLPSGEIQMGMVVVLAIVVLLTVLYLVVAGFYSFGLVTSEHALGMPEGSVRALIALFLIMIFVIVGVYVFRTVSGQSGERLENLTTVQVAELGEQVFDIVQNEKGSFDVTLRTKITETGEQLGLQLATILGTLVTAVSAFYFGSRATASAQQGIANLIGALSVDSITPNTASAIAGSIETVIIGTGFVTGLQVKLEYSGASIVPRTVIFVSSSAIKCTFDITGRSGLWDVVVINPDGSQAKKADAFEIA
ncbi:MAG: hypothetical protein H6641_08215 [Caldilineaceae bacterium]|nr:hypothetical protein [Caldilineaceae bacterium]